MQLNLNSHVHDCILLLFCRLYLLGELSEDGQVSIMW